MIKKILKGVVAIVLLLVGTLAIHIYLVTQPKEGAMPTMAMSRIDFPTALDSLEGYAIRDFVKKAEGMKDTRVNDLLAQSIGSQNIEYNGLDMVAAHNPATNPRMKGLITSEDYDLFVQAVVEAAVELNAPTSVIGEFSGLLTSPGLKGAIVQG